MDLTRDITYRGFLLNDKDIADATTGGGGSGTGISGCVVDSVDFSDVDVVQFLEKRSQGDGMDAGEAFLGMRRIRMAGTLYATTRAELFDALLELRAALNPILAQREEPLDRGYRPLYFEQPTAGIYAYDDSEDGVMRIPMRVLALPRAFQAMFDRDHTGGNALDALAIPWQATFVCRDPTLQSASPNDVALSDEQALVNSGVTGQNAGDTVTKVAHGLVNDDRVWFVTLTGGTGLTANVAYYVVNKTTNTFQVSLTSGGAVVPITTNYTNMAYFESTTTETVTQNKGTYYAPVNMVVEVAQYAGRIECTIGDSHFTITVPASTGNRIIRLKGEDKNLTVEEDDVEVLRMDLITFTGDSTWPQMAPDLGGQTTNSVTFHGAGNQASGLHQPSHYWFYERFA